MAEFHPKPFGKYFLIEKLATGGMAEIYKAKTFGVDGFEKILAIKRILPHCAVDKEFINMLVDEAKLSVLLSHTNIVQVYDLGKVGEDYFISMEFINGINLREVMNRAKEVGEKFTEDIVVYILSETCKGLDYAHSKKDNEGKPLNIVHRDISPQNILLSFEGEVKIVDFGIAKAAMNISHTMAGILKGKISYMSPEQALGKPIDRKTDIFSTGLILYEMLTGEKLFTGETQFEVLKKIRTTRLTENSFPDSIPMPLRKILAKALAYSVKDRYDNAGDMQIDLTRYLYSTYIDFTPRKLSGLMRKVFAQEIETKTTPKKEEISIDSKTRSIMIDAVAQENLVHRDNDEVTGGIVDKQPTQTFIESFISGQDEELPEITRTGQTLEPTPTPKPAAKVPAAAPKPATTEAKPKAAKPTKEPKPAKSKKWLAYPIAAMLLIGTAAGLYFKTDWFKPPPPPPPEVFGVLQINSTPEGAQVFLNDSETKLATPATLKDVKVGEPQKVTLKKPKFKDWTKTVTLIDPNPVSLTPTLEVIPVGTIKVVTTPPGAKILVDGKDTGKVSPATLEDLPLSQTYSVKLELDKHRPIEERVTVYSIEPMDFNKKLEEIFFAPIRVGSNPAGARIYLNSNDTGLSTPATLPDQEVGKRYTIRLARQGYQDIVRSIDLSDKAGASLQERLVKVEEKTPDQIAQEKLKQEQERQRQLELERQKQAQQQQQGKETDTQKQQADKLKAQQEADKQKQAQREKEAQAQREKEAQAQREKEKQAGKETETGGETFVALSSNPKGADVFINGVRKGSAPGKWKVAAGSPLEITVSKSGLSTVTKVVTLRPGETRNLGTINLGGTSADSGAAGIVVVDSNPPGAMVLLNGQPQKTTPLRIKGLRPATTHTITVKKDGYETWSTSFTVGEGTKSFMANLKKL
ncbi:MAG: PEGA domain-containing protein [Deltaproteobacteria bacterium]|nr:PEGA domain-containing protein [Deltaproteobacteria bacterium]